MQACLASVIYIQVAVLTEINPDLITYWPKFEWVSWGVGANKAKATNKHEKRTSNLYFLAWTISVTSGYIAQHKGKHGASVT